MPEVEYTPLLGLTCLGASVDSTIIASGLITASERRIISILPSNHLLIPQSMFLVMIISVLFSMGAFVYLAAIALLKYYNDEVTFGLSGVVADLVVGTLLLITIISTSFWILDLNLIILHFWLMS